MSMRTVPELVPLFATPLVIYDVPEAEPLNDDLRRVIEAREQAQPTTQHSNLGGWQSSWDMDRLGRGACHQAAGDRAQPCQSHDHRSRR
jgi:hypothetical protein